MSKLKKDFYNSFGFQNKTSQPEFTIENQSSTSFSLIRVGTKINSVDYYSKLNSISRVVYKGHATVGSTNVNTNVIFYDNFIINTNKTSITYKTNTASTLNDRTFVRVITDSLAFGDYSTEKDLYLKNVNLKIYEKSTGNKIYGYKTDGNYNANAALISTNDQNVSISLRNNGTADNTGTSIAFVSQGVIDTNKLKLDSVYFTQTNEMFQADGSGNFFDYDETLATASSDSDPNESGIARNNKIPQAILNSINSDAGLPSDKTTCKIIYDFDSSKNNDHRQVLIYKDDSTKSDRSNDAYYFYGVNSNDVEGFNEVDYDSINNDYLFAMPYSTTYIENGQIKKYRIEYEEYATSNTEDGVKFEYNDTDHIVSIKIPVFLDGSNNGRGGIVEVAGV